MIAAATADCIPSQMLLDAAIVVEDDGTILSVYDMSDDGAEETMADLMAQGIEVADFRGKLIIPGFVDGHAHAPQVHPSPQSSLCYARHVAVFCLLLALCRL